MTVGGGSRSWGRRKGRKEENEVSSVRVRRRRRRRDDDATDDGNGSRTGLPGVEGEGEGRTGEASPDEPDRSTHVGVFRVLEVRRDEGDNESGGEGSERGRRQRRLARTGGADLGAGDPDEGRPDEAEEKVPCRAGMVSRGSSRQESVGDDLQRKIMPSAAF
jgi:hypothetical protein